MLVLTRKVGERICIGEHIVLTVTAVESGRVRIGIDAPRSVPILREELCDPPDGERFQAPFLVRR
jgi:carbon storage regulator